MDKEDLEDFGIKQWNAEKFTNFDDDLEENWQLMITDNVIQDDYADALAEAGESESSSNSA